MSELANLYLADSHAKVKSGELTEECFELWGIESGTMRIRNVERTLAKARKLLADLVNELDRSLKFVESVLSNILRVTGGVPEKLSRRAIGTLYTLLADAGVHQDKV